MQSLGGISRTIRFIHVCEEIRFGFGCYGGDAANYARLFTVKFLKGESL